MLVEELRIPDVGSGLLTRAEGVELRGGVVALHGASRPERSQPLFDHLARTLGPLGFAVLSYDRRPSVDGADVPLEAQSSDARQALAVLRGHLGLPVGLYGFSQGAWAACLAASLDPEDDDASPDSGGSPEPSRRLVSFLMLLGCSGVSPAAQMRFLTEELLRRAGHGDDVRRRAQELRAAFETTIREGTDPAPVSRALSAAAGEPWFALTYLPSQVPASGESWDDMDHDPATSIARVTCPTLLLYGEDEECVPPTESEAVWRSVGERELTVVHLAGCGHYPIVGGAGGPEPTSAAAFSADYTAALESWVSQL